MFEIIVDILGISFLVGIIFVIIGIYKRKFREPTIPKEPFLPLGIALISLFFSFYLLFLSFDNKELIYEAIRLKKSTEDAKQLFRGQSFIAFIVSIVAFYRASKYNDALLQNIHIFLKWLGKKTIPSIVTTIVVAWLCHRLGFEIPSMTITSLTFGGVTFAINASLSKNA